MGTVLTLDECIELARSQPTGTYYISYINVQIKQADGDWYTPDSGQLVSTNSIGGAMFYINSDSRDETLGAWFS